MINITQTIKSEISKYAMLSHAYYQMWNNGELSKEDIQIYASQYFLHVLDFPRLVGMLYALCDDYESRKILFANLSDEESGNDNHIELWLRFTDGIGLKRDEVISSKAFQETEELINGLRTLGKTYYGGLGALYAYESQVPDISQSKICALKKFYNIEDEKTLQFFNIHLEADKWHSEEIATLIDHLPLSAHNEVINGAVAASKLLYKFLDGVMSKSVSLVLH